MSFILKYSVGIPVHLELITVITVADKKVRVTWFESDMKCKENDGNIDRNKTGWSELKAWSFEISGKSLLYSIFCTL